MEEKGKNIPEQEEAVQKHQVSDREKSYDQSSFDSITKKHFASLIISENRTSLTKNSGSQFLLSTDKNKNDNKKHNQPGAPNSSHSHAQSIIEGHDNSSNSSYSKILAKIHQDYPEYSFNQQSPEKYNESRLQEENASGVVEISRNESEEEKVEGQVRQGQGRNEAQRTSDGAFLYIYNKYKKYKELYRKQCEKSKKYKQELKAILAKLH